MVSSYDVCMSETYIHTYMLSMPETYIHTRSAALDMHTYMRSSGFSHTYIHTYTLAWACQTYIQTYMLRVGLELRHTYIHVWSPARLPEVPPVTNLKKLNW